jgi:hypothetical protein
MAVVVGELLGRIALFAGLLETNVITTALGRQKNGTIFGEL